jgi:hypothetical protein
MLKKEEVYLNITTAEQRKELIAVLREAKEPIYQGSRLLDCGFNGFIYFYDTKWMVTYHSNYKTLITIQQLREMLNVNKFKVGDTVRIINDSEGGHRLGTVGVVESYSNLGNDYCVMYDNSCRYHSAENLELVIKTFQTVTRKALAEIYPNVCEHWQKRIDLILSTDKFGDEFEVSNNLVELAYNEQLSDVQAEWLSKHLPKAKKMVTKEVVVYSNVYKDGRFGAIHLTVTDALLYVCGDVLAKGVKFTGTYQIEE